MKGSQQISQLEQKWCCQVQQLRLQLEDLRSEVKEQLRDIRREIEHLQQQQGLNISGTQVIIILCSIQIRALSNSCMPTEWQQRLWYNISTNVDDVCGFHRVPYMTLFAIYCRNPVLQPSVLNFLRQFIFFLKTGGQILWVTSYFSMDIRAIEGESSAQAY